MTVNTINQSDTKSIKRILVIQTAFIGDAILITPLIREIKNHFPNSKVDVILNPGTSDLFENNPNVNQIIIFDKRNKKFISFFRIVRYLKKMNYNIAFLPHSSITTGLMVYLSNIPRRVGFGRWMARHLLTDKIYNIGNYHKIEKNLRLLKPFSSSKIKIQTELFPNSENKRKAEKLLMELYGKVNKLIAVAPGSNWYTKMWPKEHYRELVNYLVKNEFGIVFIGSKNERELCEEIDPKVNTINLSGELSLLESAAVIKKCDLMICNDSGALHISNAVKTDVMAFFGPTVEEIGYYPIRKSDKVFEVDLDCRPCSTHGENSCKLGHHNCMRLIKPNLVIDAINKRFMN